MARTALLAGALGSDRRVRAGPGSSSPGPGWASCVLVAALAVAPALVRGPSANPGGGDLDVWSPAPSHSTCHCVLLSPFDDRDIVASIASRTWEGFLSFYDVTVPFEGIAQPFMHGVRS